MRAPASPQDQEPPDQCSGPAAAGPRLLLAEDDEAMRRLLARMLRRDGFEVIEARNGAELIERLAALLHPADGKRAVDLVVTDVRMPWTSGLAALAALRRHDQSIPVIVITAFGDEATHAEATRLGAAAILDKPFELDDLRSAVRRIVAVTRARST